MPQKVYGVHPRVSTWLLDSYYQVPLVGRRPSTKFRDQQLCTSSATIIQLMIKRERRVVMGGTPLPLPGRLVMFRCPWQDVARWQATTPRPARQIKTCNIGGERDGAVGLSREYKRIRIGVGGAPTHLSRLHGMRESDTRSG